MDETTRQYRFETLRESFRAGVAFAVGGLKCLALINGGAAIALLSFAATVSGKGQTLDWTGFKLSLWAFMFGTVAAVAASLTAFVAQDRLGHLQNHPDPLSDARLRIFRGTTFVIAAMGLLAFVLGGYWAAAVILTI